jgi:hypothetical protein
MVETVVYTVVLFVASSFLLSLIGTPLRLTTAAVVLALSVVGAAIIARKTDSFVLARIIVDRFAQARYHIMLQVDRLTHRMSSHIEEPPLLPRPLALDVGRPNLPVRRIGLRTRHEEQALTCGYCGGSTTKAFIARERWGQCTIVLAERFPVYRCETCDIEYSDMGAAAEFLARARDIMSRNDPSTASDVEEELALARRHQRHAVHSA